MFVGHYAASLALKSVCPKTSLAVLFIAVQLVEILFFGLTLAGIEKFSLIENYTASTHFQLEFMPYSHSLLAAIGWSLLVFVIMQGINWRNTRTTKTAIVIALAVLSHWCLDLIVHTPDLPLARDDSVKLGVGLWEHALLTYTLEAGLLIAGLVLYMRASHALNRLARYTMPVFVALLLLINIVNIFGPLHPDETITSMAISALMTYLVFALIAHFIDRKRQSIEKG